jgi:hypothetical protein
MKKLWLIKAVVFLAAFLLFQIEMIMSKALLPGFGGSYLVWAGAVLFFQVALLLGYGYTHLAAHSWKIRHYSVAQIIFPFVPLLFFPLKLSDLVPDYRLSFQLEIIWLLTRTVGPAFLVLSTISVMAQNLLAASDQPERNDPFFLYGTSNLGSFLALLTYPFLFEPFFKLDTQVLIWEAAFVVLAVAQAAAILLLRGPGWTEPEPAPTPAPEEQAGRTNWRGLTRWFLLSAAGSAMFLSVTNIITFELAAIPLFWMLPLGIYLFTYYLNFKKNPWCPALLKKGFILTLPAGLFLFMLVAQGKGMPAWALFLSHLAVLFLFCMYCQNELLVSRPRATRDLTGFYFALAAGGAVGSALVSFVMPLVSTMMLEYLLGFLMVAAAMALAPGEHRWRPLDAIAVLAAAPVVAWPWLYEDKNAIAQFFQSFLQGLSSWLEKLDYESWSNYLMVAAGLVLAASYIFLRDRPRAIFASLVLALILSYWIDDFRQERSIIYKHRNYYGISMVYDDGGKRYLRHGSTTHGAQYLDPEKKAIPLTYYHPLTGIGELLSSGLFPFTDMAVVGLGTGTLASYAGPGQNLDYYEIDPDIKYVTDHYFSYTKNSRGNLDFKFGDARLSLAKAKDARYDLIVLDAFNSDSIPVHLLTTEAFSLDFERLKPGGLLLVHISNRALNLEPMVFANARALGLQALYKDTEESKGEDAFSCEWMTLTRDPEAAKLLVEKLGWTDLNQHPPKTIVQPWTDSYSNIVSAIWARQPQSN